MKRIVRRLLPALISAAALIFSMAAPSGFSLTALADTTYSTKTTTVTIGESQQRNQSKTVALSRLQSVSSVSVNTGSVGYSVSGSNVTLNVSNGSPSRTYTPSETATASQTSNSNSFPATVSYNDGTYSGTLSKSGGVTTNPYANYINSPGGYFYWYASDTSLNASTPPWPVSYIGGSSGNGYGGGNPSDYPAEYAHNYIAWNGGAFYADWAGQNVRQVYVVYDHYSPSYTQGYSGTVYAAMQYYYTYTVTVTYTTQAPSISLSESGWSSSSVTVTAGISDSGGIAAQKWASGNQTTAYFNSGGTSFSGSAFTVTTNGAYTVYARDQDGNATVSGITVDHMDTAPPTGTNSLSPSGWTNGSVAISVTASDSQSGVKQIQKPDGTTVNSSTATYTVTSNGTYTFTLTDNTGNSASYPVTVSHVDTAPPTGSATLSPSTYTSHSVTISFTGSDTQSGVATVKKPDGTTVTGTTTSYSVSTNGSYNFTVTDTAGNAATVPVIVSNITQMVSVTHPVSAAFAINPNASPVFTAANIPLTNNSLIPVKVSVQSLAEIAGGTISLKDVVPTKYSDWSKLTALQTQSDIALGIKVTETSTGPNTWSEIDTTGPLYAANLTAGTQMGVLNAGGAGNLSLSALCGLAWSSSYTNQRQLTLVFSCY
jgi:hypothetical protein